MEARSPAGMLFVGSGVIMRGEIHAPDTISASGNLEGTITSKHIVVTEGGSISGQVSAQEVDVSGNASQSITATENLIIRSTGNVNGDITYLNLSVEKGGKLAGSLNVIESSRYEAHEYSYLDEDDQPQSDVVE